jgi:hypothetical protein
MLGASELKNTQPFGHKYDGAFSPERLIVETSVDVVHIESPPEFSTFTAAIMVSLLGGQIRPLFITVGCKMFESSADLGSLC